MERTNYIKFSGPNNFKLVLVHDPHNKKTILMENLNGKRTEKELPEDAFLDIVIKMQGIYRLPHNKHNKMYHGHDLEVLINTETFQEEWKNKNINDNFEVSGEVDNYLQPIYTGLTFNVIKLLHSLLN